MNDTEKLKNTGLKVTQARLKILELFETHCECHLTADEVHHKLKNDEHDIGLATVYRVLTQLEGAGLLARHHFDEDKARFELKVAKHHDHLICLDCGHVVEFYDEEIEDRQEKIAKKHGFTLENHTLALYGKCKTTNCPHKNINATNGK